MSLFAQNFFDFTRSVHADCRLRLAPTPSGFLHQGNAVNFILNWLAARYSKGLDHQANPAKLYLRIDDLDSDRTRPEYLDDIFDTLPWLELDWDAYPDPPITNPLITTHSFLQSRNLKQYFHVLEQLRERDLLFACRKSRQDLEKFEHGYPPEFRDQGLHLDSPNVAWRIKTPPGFVMPDFIVRRRDGIPAYQIASFADEIFLGITHIVRGDDLRASTAAQTFLAEVLDEDKFLKIRFLHHPLLLGERGEKLSKSSASTSISTLRNIGRAPKKIFQLVGKWLELKGSTAQELLTSLREQLV